MKLQNGNNRTPETVNNVDHSDHSTKIKTQVMESLVRPWGRGAGG
jgi:hypothetical protein